MQTLLGVSQPVRCIQHAGRQLFPASRPIVVPEMTLKLCTSELSQRARAFSVESLLNGSKKSPENSLSRKCEVISKLQTRSGITAELCCSELWEKFNRLATEMIVTKAGRRMFPTLKVRFYGLEFTANYIVYMDIILAEDTRYRYNYQRSEWSVAGPSADCVSTSVYVHPNSPARGDVWMSKEGIIFDKVKLTNHRKPVMNNQISLHSMHKYQPRIHILKMATENNELNSRNILEYIQTHSERSVTFTFEQTVFFTVTAYQNQKITNLKIQSNPFAKGFRDSLHARLEKQRQWTHVHACRNAATGYPIDQRFV